MSEAPITFYCCPNGLGHFRRVLSVAEELLAMEDAEIRIICTEQQYRSRHYWSFEKANAPGAVSFHIRNIARENGWLKDPREYDAGKYFKWVDSLKEEKLLSDGILISDNLLALLSVRKDTIMMGSFLWPDILSEIENFSDIKEIAQYESGLLRKCHPRMICIEDMAMPGVKALTDTYEVGWFGKHAKRSANGEGILISAGDTGVYTEACVKLIENLNEKGFEVFTDGRLFNACQEKNIGVKAFDFTAEDYSKIGLLLCRPGIGILTEALENKIPVIALDDRSNPEISFNAGRVVSLGFGEQLCFSEFDKLEKLIAEVLNKKSLGYYKYLNSPPMGGARQAAEFILNYNNESDL